MTAKKIPMKTGDTFGSIVSWRWDRAQSMWFAMLEDDAKLQARCHRSGSGRNRRVWWTAHVLTDVWADRVGPAPEYSLNYRAEFRTPEEAKRTAFDHYMRWGNK